MPSEIDQRMGKALAVWAKRKNVTPIIFQKKMDWSYNYAWRVLRGKDTFEVAAWGRFILAFGLDELENLFRISGIEKAMRNGS